MPAKFIHGSTHAADGTDPIPGIGSQPYEWFRRILRTGAPLVVTSGSGSTTVAWDHTSGSDDSLAYFSSSGSDAIVVADAGLYAIHVGLEWTPGHIGFQFWPILNFAAGGGNYLSWYGADPAASASVDPQPHGFTAVKRFPAGATLRLDVHQDSGSSRSLNTAYLELMLLGSFTGPDPYTENPNY